MRNLFTRTRARKACAALLLTVSLVRVTDAQIPIPGLPQVVFDPWAEIAQYAIWAEEIAKIVEQIEIARETYETATGTYRTVKENLDWDVLMAGGWENALGRLTDLWLGEAIEGSISLEKLGWEVEDLEQFEDLGSGQEAIEALEDLRKVLTGENETTELRTDVERIWGNVPVTRDGVKVEAAYQTMAEVAGVQGRIQSALYETYGHVNELEEELNAGEVAPEDRDRIRGRLEVQRARMDALQVTTANQTNQLLLHVLGMGSSNIVRQQESQIRAKEMQSMWFGAVKQGPKQRAEKVNDL